MAQREKRPEIKNTVGLTQEEMALLLGIGKSQWSMFKAGLRDLPVNAKQILEKHLTALQKKSGPSKDAQRLRKEEAAFNEIQLQRDFSKIQVKIHRIEKEIATVENQRTENFAALETVAILEASPESLHANLAKTIKARAVKALKKQSLYKLESLQLQKENLEMLKLKMEAKIKSQKK